MTIQSDILIIGGGSIGLNCGYYLLKSGRRVTIVDDGEVGSGSSWGNAGHIVPSHIIPLAAPGVISSTIKWLLQPKTSPFSLRLSVAPDYLRWLFKFALSCTEVNVQRALMPLHHLGYLSANNFTDVIDKEEFDCCYDKKGLLFLYNSDKGFADGRHEAELLGSYKIPVEIYDQQAVRQLEPVVRETVQGGILYTDDANLDPALFLRLLIDRIRAMDGEIYQTNPVTGFETARGRITKVITHQGDFQANEIILAAGSWSPAVAKGLSLNIPIQAARGYSLTAKVDNQTIRHPLLLGERRVAISPFDTRVRITGRLELCDLDRTINPKQIPRIEQAARDYLHLGTPLEILDTWAGLRPTSPDGLPIIGRSASHSNLILATGHGMLGISLGPGTGQVVSELLNGSQPEPDLTPFSPDRF